jgi:hypothetical protein
MFFGESTELLWLVLLGVFELSSEGSRKRRHGRVGLFRYTSLQTPVTFFWRAGSADQAMTCRLHPWAVQASQEIGFLIKINIGYAMVGGHVSNALLFNRRTSSSNHRSQAE